MISFSNPFFSLIQLLINFAVYLFFILKAFKGKMRYSYWINGFAITAYSVLSIMLIMLSLLINAPYSQHRYLMLFFWLLSSVFTARFLIRSNLLELLFLVFVIMDIQFNIMQISIIINKLNFVPHLLKSKELHILIISNLVLLIFAFPMYYLFLHLFKKVIDLNINRNYWKYMFFIPITIYLYCVFTSINYSLKNGIEGWTALLILLLLNSFSIFSYVAVLQMLIKSHESSQAKEYAAFTEQQLMIQVEQYKKLAENIDQTERLHHDMRHHFIAIKGYTKNKDLEGADRYLDDCIGNKLPKEETPICENHSVDMILRQYLAIAREMGVQVKTSLQLPHNFCMADTDLCIIFGNLVENAVESCKVQSQGTKFITVKSKVINDYMLVITVLNSFEGSIVKNGEAFVSKKHKGLGIGTASVRSIVEKNGGNCKFSFEDNVFKASILLVR